MEHLELTYHPQVVVKEDTTLTVDMPGTDLSWKWGDGVYYLKLETVAVVNDLITKKTKSLTSQQCLSSK